ncbi:transcription factor IIA, alpha/beta subunit, partial [Aureobasidium melanogenum]
MVSRSVSPLCERPLAGLAPPLRRPLNPRPFSWALRLLSDVCSCLIGIPRMARSAHSSPQLYSADEAQCFFEILSIEGVCAGLLRHAMHQDKALDLLMTFASGDLTPGRCMLQGLICFGNVVHENAAFAVLFVLFHLADASSLSPSLVLGYFLFVSFQLCNPLWVGSTSGSFFLFFGNLDRVRNLQSSLFTSSGALLLLLTCEQAQRSPFSGQLGQSSRAGTPARVNSSDMLIASYVCWLLHRKLSIRTIAEVATVRCMSLEVRRRFEVKTEQKRVAVERRQARTLAASKGLNFVRRHPTCLLTTQYGHHRAIVNKPLIVPDRIQEVSRSHRIWTHTNKSSKDVARPQPIAPHCASTPQHCSIAGTSSQVQRRQEAVSEVIVVMSNIITGEIYEKIIQEVINASQNDFEENGVQQQTLVELQQSWQHKMSQRDVAQMPWDPKPAPPPPQQPAQQQQAQQPTPTPLPVQNGAPVQHQAPQNGHAQPKAESGSNAQPMHNYPPAQQAYPQQVNNQMMAQQRAASLLQQQFGQQANASLNAMQQRGIALPGGIQNAPPQQQSQQQQQQQQQQRPQGLQLPAQAGQTTAQPAQAQQQRQMQAQYAQQMRQQTAHQQPQVKVEGNGQYPQQPGVNYSQTDGSDEAALDEWKRYITERRRVSSAQEHENDRMMRRQIEDLQHKLENGLLLPLDDQKEHRRHTKHVSARRGRTNNVSRLASIPQLDGDVDEEDEDAINSDLDSSSDEAGNNADEEDEEIDHVLCTYDKVQRVKNKWKCTLKDGIMSANGKEYLFHKAQGEFECGSTKCAIANVVKFGFLHITRTTRKERRNFI